MIGPDGGPQDEEVKETESVPDWFNYDKFRRDVGKLLVQRELEFEEINKSNEFRKVETFKDALEVESTMRLRFKADDEIVICTVYDEQFQEVRYQLTQIILDNIAREKLPENYEDFSSDARRILKIIQVDDPEDLIPNLVGDLFTDINYFIIMERETASPDADYRDGLGYSPEELNRKLYEDLIQ